MSTVMEEKGKKEIKYWYIGSNGEKKSFENLSDISEERSNLKIFRGEAVFHCFELFVDLKSYSCMNFEKNEKWSISFVRSERKETEDTEDGLYKFRDIQTTTTIWDHYIFIHYFPEEIPTISGKIYPSRVITPENIKDESLSLEYYFDKVRDRFLLSNVGNFNIFSHDADGRNITIVLYKGTNPVFLNERKTIQIMKEIRETNHLYLEDILIVAKQNTQKLLDWRTTNDEDDEDQDSRQNSTFFLFKGIEFSSQHPFSKVLRFFSLFSRKNSKEKNMKSLYVVLSNHTGSRKWSVRNYMDYSAEFQRFVCHLLFCQKYTSTNFQHLPVDCIHFCILPFIAELDILNVMNEDCIFRNSITWIKERDQSDNLIYTETEFKKCIHVLLQRNTVPTIRQVFKSMEYIQLLFQHLETLDPERDLERFLQVSNTLLLVEKEELDQSSTQSSASTSKTTTTTTTPKNDENLCILNKVFLSALMNFTEKSSHYEETIETLVVFLRRCERCLIRSILAITKIASRIPILVQEENRLEKFVHNSGEGVSQLEEKDMIIQYYPKIFSEFRLSYDLIVSLEHAWSPVSRISFGNVLQFILKGITPNDIFRPREIRMSSLSQRNSNRVVFYRILEVVEKWIHLNISIEERAPEIISFFNLLIRKINYYNEMNVLNSPNNSSSSCSTSSREVSRNVRILLGLLLSAFSFSDAEKVDTDLRVIFSELILLPQVEKVIQNSLTISATISTPLKKRIVNKQLKVKCDDDRYEIEISNTFFNLTTRWLKSHQVITSKIRKSNEEEDRETIMIINHFNHFNIFSHMNDHFSEDNSSLVLSSDSETGSLVELIFSLLSLESLEILEILSEKTNLILSLFQRYYENLKRMFLGGEITDAFQHIIQTLRIFDFRKHTSNISEDKNKYRRMKQFSGEMDGKRRLNRLKIIKYFLKYQLFSKYVRHSFSLASSSISSSHSVSSNSSFPSNNGGLWYSNTGFYQKSVKTKIMHIVESIENIVKKSESEIDEDLQGNLERLKSLVFQLHHRDVSSSGDNNKNIDSSFVLSFSDEYNYDSKTPNQEQDQENNEFFTKTGFEELNFFNHVDDNSSPKKETRTSSWRMWEGENTTNNNSEKIDEEFVFSPIEKDGEDEKDHDLWNTNNYQNSSSNESTIFEFETSNNASVGQTNENQAEQGDVFEF